jgi:hypothetical protein
MCVYGFPTYPIFLLSKTDTTKLPGENNTDTTKLPGVNNHRHHQTTWGEQHGHHQTTGVNPSARKR